jgi:hypothetical protein
MAGLSGFVVSTTLHASGCVRPSEAFAEYLRAPRSAHVPARRSVARHGAGGHVAIVGFEPTLGAAQRADHHLAVAAAAQPARRSRTLDCFVARVPSALTRV